ncbi:MAG: carbon storage regulator CsrA [Lachnospiraceae bacterium]|nr:carbon storage regulator CsrA [Lachnospiraceae bacterium]
MLTLSRKKGESLVVNNNIEVTILDIRGDQVKLGVAAPKEVPIYRKEIYDEIHESNKNAVSMEGMEALKKIF